MPARDDTDTDLEALLADAPTQIDEFAATTPDAGDSPAADSASPDATEAKTDETPSTPAQPERPRGPKKPWWDIYTSMLAVTLLAIILGCVFLLMEWSRYNFETSPPTTSSPAAGAGGG